MSSTNHPNLNQSNHLIIVCCHAIYIGGPNHGTTEDEWLIEPFQKGETPTFMEHAKAGLEVLMSDPYAVLVFSGGPTKQPRTELSEAQSYLNLVRDNNYFQNVFEASAIDPSRIIPEHYATDSYQNVLFSLLRFGLYTGVYPERVTVVTHEFKRARFMECHFPAVGLLSRSCAPSHTNPSASSAAPATQKVAVIGINPPQDVTPVSTLVSGEMENGIGLWRRDLYGVGVDLAGKRRRRGWCLGMEEGVFVNAGLEDVVEQLVCWDGGRGNNDLFPKMKELPWYPA